MVWGINQYFPLPQFHLNIFIQNCSGKHKTIRRWTSGTWQVVKTFRQKQVTGQLQKQKQYQALVNISNARLYGYPQDASYTRIKDVTLSYTAPQKLLDALKLGGLTFYASGRNLATFTKWVGWDPEADFTRGIFTNVTTNPNSFPLVRSIIFGANITLR